MFYLFNWVEEETSNIRRSASQSSIIVFFPHVSLASFFFFAMLIPLFLRRDEFQGARKTSLEIEEGNSPT